MSCSSCGAVLRAGMTWCGQCFTPVAAAAEPAAPAVPRRWVPAPGLETRQVYSRWHGGPTSFGPTGRIACTVTLVLFEYWLWRFNLLGFAITMITVVPLVLRDVWKRSAVQEQVRKQV
ncbi:MAG: hypothetical protein ABR549_17510 [Mycobacteriales bacterium]